MTTTDRVPDYLQGHFAPVPDEITAHDLPVSGALPPELTGRYLRNGPNPLPGEDPGHWFAGHGMLHGIRLRDGRAEWYRNRWVRTGLLEGRPPFTPDGTPDLTAVPANTHVVPHAGRILALVEAGLPYEVTPDLGTVGAVDFGGRLRTAMTAHPKTDPVTGDLHAFGYGFTPPYLTYHRVSAAGELVASAGIAVPGPTLMHDFAITERHAIFLDLPMTFRMDIALTGAMPYQWDDGYGARMGVMPLERPGEVRWFEIDPCFVFHVGNAHTDERGRIVVDGARYSPADVAVMWPSLGDDPAGPAASAAATGQATLHRWTLDPATGAVTETALSEAGPEFPTVDDAVVGRPNRYTYAVLDSADIAADIAAGTGPSGVPRAAVLRHDRVRDELAVHELGPDVVAGEAVFVPSAAPDRAEDDGWLLSITTTRDGRASELLVLDARAPADDPVARVTLPRGVPSGFHGSWVPDPQA
ncbi:carotenoid oxygenase family protein [Pseudonocardia sp. NPDC049635]|uniref:carotenoid oxygenase family protein n=1 Tax=Pseudonocardia sp. NPDC049635 TaxID=3155506 RepID=UPI0033BFEBCD